MAAAPDISRVVPGAQRVPIAHYVLLRLKQLGVDALFGVPGATCDPLFAAAEQVSLELVITASDLDAGYAADGYARTRGLGAVSVTCGVGMLSLAAAISGAFAEHSPVVVINGGPSADGYGAKAMLGDANVVPQRGHLVCWRSRASVATTSSAAAARTRPSRTWSAVRAIP